jgi:Ca2+-binding RTX toxin-like protein
VKTSLLAGCLLAVTLPLPLAAQLCEGLPATLTGTDGNDNLLGTAGDDVIVALGGNDLVDGAGGDDIVCGGDGADVVNGTRGVAWVIRHGAQGTYAGGVAQSAGLWGIAQGFTVLSLDGRDWAVAAGGGSSSPDLLVLGVLALCALGQRRTRATHPGAFLRSADTV